MPPVIIAAFSILPHLLAAQIMTQNTLLAQYYTLLHNFCEEESFPDPPQQAPDILSTWDMEFKPVKQQIETGIASVARGKAVQLPMQIEEKAHGSLTGLNIRNNLSSQRRPSNRDDHPHGSMTGMNIRNGISAHRHPSGQQNALKPAPSPGESPEPPSPDPNTRSRISSVPSQTSLALATPSHSSSAVASPSPGDVPATHAPAGPRADYFGRDRLPLNSSITSIAAGKKKPPPPPPKRLPSMQGTWVTALYDFAGEGQGDLTFSEGDRIKVVKKTESTDDWWEGELKGVHGSFPANYCQLV